MYGPLSHRDRASAPPGRRATASHRGTPRLASPRSAAAQPALPRGHRGHGLRTALPGALGRLCPRAAERGALSRGVQRRSPGGAPPALPVPRSLAWGCRSWLGSRRVWNLRTAGSASYVRNFTPMTVPSSDHPWFSLPVIQGASHSTGSVVFICSCTLQVRLQ